MFLPFEDDLTLINRLVNAQLISTITLYHCAPPYVLVDVLLADGTLLARQRVSRRLQSRGECVETWQEFIAGINGAG